MAIEDLYNAKALVETPTPTQTATGSWEDSWATTEAALPCRWQPVSGVEGITDAKETVVITHKMFCATTASVGNKDRVTVGGIVTRVHSIRNIDVMGHHYEIALTSKV